MGGGRQGSGEPSFLIMSRRWKVVNVSSRRRTPRGDTEPRGVIATVRVRRERAGKIKTGRGPGKCHRERFRRKDLGHKYVTRTFAATAGPCFHRRARSRSRSAVKLDDNDYDWLPFVPYRLRRPVPPPPPPRQRPSRNYIAFSAACSVSPLLCASWGPSYRSQY